jgi:hypothetical protein
MVQSEDPYSNISWGIEAPDGGLYYVVANAPKANLASRKPDVEAMLATFHLTPWSIPVQATDGLAHLSFPQGFSFDYPANWSVYYPVFMSMGSAPVVTVSSKPLIASVLGSPCPSGSLCGGTPLWEPFTPGSSHPPPGSVVISFAIGRPSGINWSEATTILAGQPAFQHWGPQTDAGEGGFWTARLGDTGLSVDVDASILSPDVPAQRATLDAVIASIRIAPQASAPP